LYGGVSILEILAIILYFMVSAFMVSVIGFYFSVRFKKSITAIIMTYLVTSFLYVGTFIIYFITGSIASIFITDYTQIQPFLIKVANICFVPNPFYGLITMLYDDPSVGGILYMFGGYGAQVSTITWFSNVIFALMLSGLLLLLSKNRLSKVK
jgi:ABC-2 type transport system permease protein